MSKVKKKEACYKSSNLLATGLNHTNISFEAPTLVIDNGAGCIKYGWSTDEGPLGTMSNAVAKIHKTLESVVGDEIDSVQGATSQLRFSRPFDRGYLTNWNIERDIWERMFSTKLNADPQSCHLVLTMPPFCPEELQQDTSEVLFEEMGFASALCKSAPWFSSYHYAQSRNISEGPDQFRECNVVVDSGFSFTHAIPFVNGVVRPHSAKRVNVGGKLLTNYLKEVISYRQWNFMDEFLLVNEVKDSLCFVSQDFVADLSQCQLESPNMRVPRCMTSSQEGDSCSTEVDNRNEQSTEFEACDDSEDEEEDDGCGFLKKFFVLPDFHHTMRGFVKQDGADFNDHDQVLTMESERFSIPEVLFHPSDIGINQAGIVEATGEAIRCLGEIEGELCTKNILLTGGNANLPGYKQRFQRDIKQYLPNHWDINVFQPEDPSFYAWRGAALFSRVEQQANRFHNYAVTRDEYLEHGHAICLRKYRN